MATDDIPFLDLPAQHQPLADALQQGFARLVQTARFVGGEDLARFERRFAELCGTEACVGLNSGTDAVMLGLRALGVGPGDEVLLPAYTFIATAEAVTLLGASPRLVDIDAETFTVTAATLRAAASPKVRAVIPVHLYGQPAPMAEIVELAQARDWRVLEDAAQAHGARWDGKPAGAWGDLAAFSFYPGKNLGALGDAGAVVGPAGDRMQRLRRLANHGRRSRYEHDEPGVNSRLDTIQAMALDVKLDYLASWNAARRQVAAWYDALLGELPDVQTPQVRPEALPVYHLYVILVPERQRLQERLSQAGIGSAVQYPKPLHMQPAYAELGYGSGDFPVSERVADACLSLPIFPEMTRAQVERTATVIAEHLRAGSD